MSSSANRLMYEAHEQNHALLSRNLASKKINISSSSLCDDAKEWTAPSLYACLCFSTKKRAFAFLRARFFFFFFFFWSRSSYARSFSFLSSQTTLAGPKVFKTLANRPILIILNVNPLKKWTLRFRNLLS